MSETCTYIVCHTNATSMMGPELYLTYIIWLSTVVTRITILRTGNGADYIMTSEKFRCLFIHCRKYFECLIFVLYLEYENILTPSVGNLK